MLIVIYMAGSEITIYSYRDISPYIGLHSWSGSLVAFIITTKFSLVFDHIFQQKSRQFVSNCLHALLWQELIPHLLELYIRKEINMNINHDNKK